MKEEPKTNLKFTLDVVTEQDYKQESILVDFFVTLGEFNELILFFRKNEISPDNIKFEKLNDKKQIPDIIKRLYKHAYDIAFPKHLQALMWTLEDFYDEANYLSHTRDLDNIYAGYDFDTGSCDSIDELAEKEFMNNSIEVAYNNRYEISINNLRRELLKDDKIEFSEIVNDLIL